MKGIKNHIRHFRHAACHAYKRPALALAGLTACLLLPYVMKAQAPSPDYKLMYEDNFNGDALNENDWMYRTGKRTGANIDGLNSQDAVSVHGGLLHIGVKQDLVEGKKENIGGGVISRHQFGYGYYETRSKPFMLGTGVHSAFWQAGGSVENNAIFEIDSYEIDSKYWMGCNNLYVHLATKDASVPWVTRANVPLRFNQQGWLVDAYEYTPGGVIFYDNGKEVARAAWNELTAAQSIWLTALNGVGKVDSTAFPGETVFDYFRYYAKDYPGVNILPNGSFEYNQNKIDAAMPVAWQQAGTAGAGTVVKGNASRDEYKLRHASPLKEYSMVTSQRLEYIMNGEYTLTAMARSSGGQKEARIAVAGFGGAEMSVPVSAGKNWTRIEIPGIMITNNSAEIRIISHGQKGQWLEVDDIQFMKPLLPGQHATKPKPFALFGDAVWKQGMQQPITFTGDDKFYFFSREVGYGDSISVALRITADALSNASPVARLPQKGPSGWAVYLNNAGGVIFRVGSREQHTDVVAENAYKAGQPCYITCVFAKGAAAIYIDGKPVKRVTGIQQNTKDSTAPGRLGNTRELYQAVGDVIQKTDALAPDPHSSTTANFSGTISDVQIFNRAVSDEEIRVIAVPE
jgi:hypothetical protein